MKKKLSVLAVMVLVIISVVALTACNPYKWESGLDSIPSGPVSSNGGYFVRQGDYAFFINGKGGDIANNEFGVPFKQSIMRAKIVDGKVDNATAQVVVPQVIHNEHNSGGFAIYGQWIYYLTTNNELGSDKKPNTTMSNLMRTKTDGSITQRIATFGTRNVNIFYAPNRILYFEGNAIKYFDVSAMKENKSFDNGKGATAGVLVSNATDVMWNYDSEYIFYTRGASGDTAYRGYNELCCIKADGSGQQVLITQDSYISDKNFEENIENYYNSIFTIKLVNATVESKDQIALYYTKTTIGNNGQLKGLFVNKYKIGEEFNVNNEKLLSTVAPSGAIYALGYDNGCLASNDAGFVLYDGIDLGTKKALVPSGSKVLKVIKGYIYYMPSDTSAVYKVKLEADPKSNVELVMQEKVTEWLTMDWDIITDENGNITNANMYFFATDDYTYLHVVDVLHFNPVDEPFIDSEGTKEKPHTDGKYDEGEEFVDMPNGTKDKWDAKDNSQLVGKRTDADQKAYDEAHKDDKK